MDKQNINPFKVGKIIKNHFSDTDHIKRTDKN